MKINSFASGTQYVVGQFYIDPTTLVFHFQSTEQMPGWNTRGYGSSVNARLIGKDSDWNTPMLGLLGALDVLNSNVSYTGSGRKYTKCAIRPDGKHFQVWCPLTQVNRTYGFAGDLELVNAVPEAPKFVAPPKPVTRHASLAGTGASYVIGQVRLGVTGEHNEEKWVHMQAKEQLPGWEPREYGSSKDVRVGRNVVEILTSNFEEGYYEDPKSLAGTGKQYATIYIRPDGKHFQMPCNGGEINRSYGFAFDEKPKA